MRDAKPIEAIPTSPLGRPARRSGVARPRPSDATCTSRSTRRAATRTAPTARSSSRSAAPDAATTSARARRSARRAEASSGRPGTASSTPGRSAPGTRPHWEFVPGYRHGQKPFGEWPASSLATTRQWQGYGAVRRGGDSAFDFGAATVAARAGQTLEDRIGARRLAFNQPRGQVYSAYGYPADRPPPEFDGEQLFRCKSPFQGTDRSVGPPSALRISCDMTGGSSGGGWVIQSDHHGYVASVTSYGYSDDPAGLYGPYQGGDRAQPGRDRGRQPLRAGGLRRRRLAARLGRAGGRLRGFGELGDRPLDPPARRSRSSIES